MVLIEVKDLKKKYENEEIVTNVLKGIDLSIEKKDFAALIGPSGSGKTTLLNIIGGLDTATSGSVIIDGETITDMSKKDLCKFRRDKLGFIFQSYNLIPVLTAYENVEYPLTLLKMSKSERRSAVEEMLELVGLEEMMNKKPSQMSGGQQQRVAIARALVCKPTIVLADEPTANLDYKTGAQIINLLKTINKRQGTTFLFSTHDQRIMEFAQRTISLNDGKIGEIRNKNEWKPKSIEYEKI